MSNFLSISEAAAKHIKKIIKGSSCKALRIGLKKGGCAGMEYTMDLVEEIKENDEVIQSNGQFYWESGSLAAGTSLTSISGSSAILDAKAKQFAAFLNWGQKKQRNLYHF